METLKNIEEAEKVVKEGSTLYLVSFFIDGRSGSTIIAIKGEVPLYHLYFIVRDFARNGPMNIQVMSIQKIS